MKRTIEITEEDAWRIYELIEEMNAFLHQPTNRRDPESMGQWLGKEGAYAALRAVYYDVMRGWFPVDPDTGEVALPPGASPKFDQTRKCRTVSNED